MLINQNELEKLCKYLYPKFFDYKDISLYDLNIKIDDYLHPVSYTHLDVYKRQLGESTN